MKEFTILIVLILGTIIGIGIYEDSKSVSDKYDLEIYTTEEIIYVNHLTITYESGFQKTFKNKEELKEFISDVTLKQNKPCN